MGWDDPKLAKLARERRFNEAWDRAQSGGAPGGQTTRHDQMLLAGLMRDAGRYDRALELYERFADADIWAWVWQRKLEATQDPPRANASERLDERDLLKSAIETKRASCVDPAGRAALLWLEAEIFTGLRLDDRVTDGDLVTAEELLEQARNLVPDSTWPLPEIARVVRFRAGRDEDHTAAMTGAWQRLEMLEMLEGSVDPEHEGPIAAPLRDPEPGLVYERGRLALLDRKWQKAAAAFTDISEPSHQHARVWRIYALRLQFSSSGTLLVEIDRLLGPGLSRKDVATGRVRGEPRYADPYPRVCRPELVAMLLAERAAILESTDAEQALHNYLLALELRPAMLFAKRGRLRCLDASGARADAEGLAQEFLEEAERPSTETAPIVAAELLVEVGRHHLARYNLDDALECFRRAIEMLPNYGYAHERMLVARSMNDERERAVTEGKNALARSGGLRGENGVRVELANVLLELGRTDEALTTYDDLVDDETAAIRDRASAGGVHAYRYARDYAGAQSAIRRARKRERGDLGFRVWDAWGRLSCDIGDFSAGLRQFEHGLELRPRERALISGKARTLRLLGRPSQALAFLKDRRRVMGVFASEIDADHGWAELECGCPTGALAHFHRAHKRDRHDVLALRGIVVASSQHWAYGVPLAREIKRLRDLLGPQRYAAGGLLTELGCRCAARGAFTDARALFDEADDESASTSQRITQLLAQGHTLIEAHALDDAASTLDVIEALEDGRYRLEPNVRLLRAKWHLVHGETDTAAAIFAEIHRRYERSQLAIFGRAAAMSRQDDAAGAARSLEDLLARLQRESGKVVVDPNRASNESVLAREILVRIRLRLSADADARTRRNGKTDPALESGVDQQTRRGCKEILAVEPRSSQAYIALGVLAARRGEVKQARLDIAQAAAIAPTRAEPTRELGWIALEANDHDAAEIALEAAARLDPHDSRVHLLRGQLHLQRNEQIEAIRILRLAVALDPSSPDCAAALADALDREGDSEEALRILSDAQSRIPRRDTLRLRLASARINHAAATGEKRHLRQRLLEEAAHEASCAAALARSLIDRAEVHYHKGVICHAQGSRKAAGRELKQCLKLDPDHFQARRAQAIIGSHQDDDGVDLHVRTWAGRLGWIGVALLFALLVDLILRAVFGTRFIPEGMVGGVGIAAMASLAGAALLPRLTSLNVRGVGSLTVTPSLEDGAKPATEIPFGRLPLSTLSGPGTGQLSPITPDTAGLASS
jgi:tetratricopeptide (TPR) repeat protein